MSEDDHTLFHYRLRDDGAYEIASRATGASVAGPFESQDEAESYVDENAHVLAAREAYPNYEVYIAGWDINLRSGVTKEGVIHVQRCPDPKGRLTIRDIDVDAFGMDFADVEAQNAEWLPRTLRESSSFDTQGILMAVSRHVMTRPDVISLTRKGLRE